MRDDLRNAFEAARYRVFFDADSLGLHIGAPCPAPIAGWLAHHAFARCGWLITAQNPSAEQIGTERNSARDALLRCWAARRATAWLNSVNEDSEGIWPDEPGVLLAGVDEGEVRAMARRFGQAAIVAVHIDSPVSLIWL